MNDLTWTLLLAAAPALVGALLPRKWAYAWFGWYAFLLGLLFLDYRPPSPLEETWTFRSEGTGLWLSAAFAAAAFAVRRTVDAVRARPPLSLSYEQRFLLSWELPIGILAAILVFHGLCHVMAGIRPAWLAHLIVIIGIGVGLAVLVHRFTFAKAPPVTPMLLALVFLVMMMVNVGGGMTWALILSGRASNFADGAPYCLLAFDRAGNPRPATSSFDLSRLVMRSGGRYAAEEREWLVVQTRWGPVGYRHLYGNRFEVGETPGPPACTPS